MLSSCYFELCRCEHDSTESDLGVCCCCPKLVRFEGVSGWTGRSEKKPESTFSEPFFSWWAPPSPG